MRFNVKVRSIRMRLLLAMMLAICTVWAGWFGCQMALMSTQQTGYWDMTMRTIGQQILRSVPRTDAYPGAPFETMMRLPPEVKPLRGDLYYQVLARDGTTIIRSAEAPLTPFAPMHTDAFEWMGQVQHASTVWRVYTLWDAEKRVQVQLAKRQDALDAEMAAWLERSIVVAGLLIVVLGTVSWWTIRWTMRPVRRVRDALSQRSSMDLRPVPTAELPSELGPLVSGFNLVLAQLETALRAEQRFLADAAHELRTPLAVLTAQARLVQSSNSIGEAREAMGPLVAGIERASRLTEQLLDSAGIDAATDATGRPPVDLHEVVTLLTQDCDVPARQAYQRLLLDIEPCALPVDVDTLGVMLRNLLDNALRYSGPGARIQAVCRRVAVDGGWRVALGVRDDGPGVPEAERARIFDRFYRVPGTTGRGSGIGLSLVARIAEMHGARVDVGTGLEGRGLSVLVRFDAHPVDGPHQGAAGEDITPGVLTSGPTTAATT